MYVATSGVARGRATGPWPPLGHRHAPSWVWFTTRKFLTPGKSAKKMYARFARNKNLLRPIMTLTAIHVPDHF